MRKLLLISTMLVTVSISTFAGGLLTNTNQHAAWVRMIARGASIDIDGVYSNPAGLVFMEDGFYMSLNAQSVYQTRTINSTFGIGKYPTVSEEFSKKYKGKANAPVVPSIQAVYKKGDWAFSGSFAIVGGGGKAKFNEGLPVFDSKVMNGLYANGLSPNQYDIYSSMHGRQYIYGLQLGATYKINEYLGVFAGARINYVNSGYEGYLDAIPKGSEIPLVEMALDVDQTGWGITPIIGADLKYGKWNLGLKYEFLTSLHVTNKTKLYKDPNDALSEYKDGVNTPHDIPSLFTAAIGYEFLPTLRATVEYHHFFDKNARMAEVSTEEGPMGKQKTLKHGTHEFLVGAEWDITKLLTISAGYQKTNYGVTKAFQTDTAFSLDSYTVGFGAALNLSSKIKLNVGYFWTTYDDFTKETLSYNDSMLPGTDIYSRTNKVFGIGIDYKF